MATNYEQYLEGFQSPTQAVDTEGDYSQYLEGFQSPSISPETVEAVGKPTGVPTESPEAPTAPTEAPEDIGSTTGIPQLFEDPELPMAPTGLMSMDEAAGEQERIRQLIAAKQKMDGQENLAATKEFARTEALPVVGGVVATALAPVTGGTSYLLSAAIIAGATGAGAMVGEGIEQTLKHEGYIDLGVGEEAPKDAWDVWNRSVAKAGEEAAWSLVPDMLLRGIPVAKRKLMTLGGRPTETITGEVVDVGRKNMVDMMNAYASKKGMQEGDVLLASDVAHIPLFNMAEDVSRNSYIAEMRGGKKISEVRTTQEEAIKEGITETVETFMNPAKGYVTGSSNEALAKYIEPNMESLNSFAVAGLINTGFSRAQEAQKSVARGIYGTIGELMEQTTMKSVLKETPTAIMGFDGKPINVMREVLEEQHAYPVDLRGVSEFVDSHLDDTLFTADDTLVDLVGLPSQASYKQAANTLSDLKARSRKLEKSMDEFAPRRLRMVNKAIDALSPAVDDAMRAAEQAGITGPDGTSLTALKGQADAIWKEQVEDFQNSYIAGILKQADSVNGAPDKLGSLFMKNEAAASKISKILNDSKADLTGDALENVLAAENAMKGSIIQDIFMPFDNMKGEFVAPNTALIHSKASTLKRLFTEEEYDGLVKLSGVIDTQSRQGMSNFLGFAQRARESGMVMGTLKSLTQANFGPLLRDGGATVMFALGMGKILTKPQNLKLATMLADTTLPEPMRIQVMQQLVHRTYDFQRAQDDALTPDQRERLQAAHDDREEEKKMRKGF